MERCPSCGAHREASDDYCPVCGETLTEVQLSEATGEPWYDRQGTLLVLVLLFWPAALYGLYRQGDWNGQLDWVILAGSLAMALVWLSLV
ncbi:MAG: hypothetical protein BRD54_00390 [Bacteroidetes bacterium SW_8_64_56]|jgi:hypothetical protein|nr:MAG: hypothetical protein BRD53_01720 [Bacteroidetes bacterium SW_7_64_58]PSR05245.1 MAG: hypothetical protein BRD54_00390 [Bacteroidetes bacterium SW_8_64_56]